jgi:hypothetical protein
MNRIITFVLSLLFIFSKVSAQDKLDYDNDSRWFWGINVGATWQTTDVKNLTKAGLGLTLGKSFNQDYGKGISFDLRGRYLYGNWYGQDVDTTGFQRTNAALSSGATNYKDGLGYSVLNFRTEVHELSLELVLHANKLRNRTGWDPYIFGGVGFTWSQTKGNQLNTTDSTGNSMYAYDQLSDYSLSSLKTIQDKSYETVLDGSKPGVYSINFMPSIGFGLAYQVGPRFSIGVEHKTTFTRLDNFDGYVDPTSKRANDLYHYTSAFLRFQVRDHRPERPVKDPDSNLGNVPNYNEPVTTTPAAPQLPVVHFTNPAVSGTTVSQPNYTIRADVKNVDGKNNILFRHQNLNVVNFSYNPTTDKLEANVVLQPGQNVFEIVGSNATGSDDESTLIIYQREAQALPPVVTITNPSASPQTVTNPAYNFTATVLNVQQANQVTVTVNGQAFPNFSFNASNSGVAASLNLVVGTNIVTVTGTNAVGTDSESATIIYRPGVTEQLPVVYFVDPHVNPYTTTSPTFTINADVLNVAGRQNITFKQNGNLNQNFTYNAGTDDFQSAVVLNPGQNVFEIIGTNTAGTAQATTIIIYEKPAPRPPVVTITNPSVNPYTTENNLFVLGATVLNVTTASQIQVTLNGQNVPNFSYVNSNNSVIANLTLGQGANVVTVTGTNNDGTDMKQTTIIYRPSQVQQPPVVTFTAPSTDPYTTQTAAYNVTATVLNVSAASGINVNINGVNFTAFSFTAGTQSVSFPITLIEGANLITITGTNTAGTDSENQTIILRKPQQVAPPIVTFTDPITNPLTVFNQTYNLQVRVQHVGGAQNIQLKINGSPSTNFSYSTSSEMMAFNTSLNIGANIFEIIATNTAGQDAATTTIIFKVPDPVLPPTVTITTPTANPHTVSIPTTPITANVLNVDGAQNIQVLLNGTPFTGFSYNTSTKQLSFTMSLIEGANMLQITGTNPVGQASDSRTIIYKKEVVVLPPFVTFLNPLNPGSVVNTQNFAMRARVTNVDLANQVIVLQDGQSINPALYSFDATTKEILFNTSLNSGNNVFTVTGTNSAGTHSATTNVTYTIPVVICDNPIVSITSPNAAGMAVSAQNTVLNAQLTHITQASQVQVLLNGVVQPAGTFNTSNNVYTLAITLTEGQNTIEVIATNACGTKKANRTILYKPVTTPCVPPVLQSIAPAADNSTVETSSVNIQASVINVSNASEIQLKVNGVDKPFTFDNVMHLVNAQVTLNEGENTIQVQVSNGCGSARILWTVTRRVCVAPVIHVISSSVEDNATTYGESFALQGNVEGITANTQLAVTQNNTAINFVFNPQTFVFTLDRPLTMGANAFVLTATNACGTVVKKLNVTRQRDPKAVPPVITITNPSVTPFNTTEGAMNVQVSTQYVTASSQVSVTINGTPTNFDFNPNTGTLSFNRSWVDGANVIVATTVTAYGTASDTKTVFYRKPVVVQPPNIVLTNPKICPAVLTAGTNLITGYVTNITTQNQVTVSVNGQVQSNYNAVLNNGNLSFQLTLNLVAGSNVTLSITASNGGGSDAESCTLTVPVAQQSNNLETGQNTGTLLLKPRISITNPAVTPFTAKQNTMVIQVSTQQVTQASEVTVTVNGAAVPFNFNTADKTLSFTQQLINGPNVIVATATNSKGTTTDTKTILYTAPSTALQAPKIILTNPAAYPVTLTPGKHTIKGYATNVTDANQLKIMLNGAIVSVFNPVVTNGNLMFEFQVELARGSGTETVILVTAFNAAGNDRLSCTLTEGIPTISRGGTGTFKPTDITPAPPVPVKRPTTAPIRKN